MKMKKIMLSAILVIVSIVLFAGCKKEDAAAKTYTLNVTATNGTVVINPNKATYNSGDIVQITATPNTDYIFTSWSGDSISSTNPLPVTINANKNITANFTKGVNVKNTGATGNGITDDTAPIQLAIDQVGGTGGTVFIPAGTYMINALTSLNLKSNMTLRMESGAVLKAITTNQGGYNIIAIINVSNVNVIGGSVEGERSTHVGTSGEWGFGIGIFDAQNVFIESVKVSNCWGDGFYLGSRSGIIKTNTNIILANVIADNNRRQGLSIVSGDSVIVRNSIFKNTKGTAPMAGIDIEPNAGMTVKNVQIINNEVMGNQHHGIQTFVLNSTAIITNLTINGNNVHDNGIQYKAYGMKLITLKDAIVSGNNVHNNAEGGIELSINAIGNFISNNIVSNNGTYGIKMSTGSTGNTIKWNIVTMHVTKDIIDQVGGNTITGNTTGN